MNKNILKILVATAVVAPLSAYAATTTDTMSVTAEVTASCSVSAAALSLGAYDPVADAEVATGLADLTVTCTNGAGYEIGLDAGTTTGGTTATRKLDIDGAGAGTETLDYQLFSDSARTVNWSTIADTTDTAVTGTGSGVAQTHTVYGKIPAGQTTAKVASTYEDTVTVTVQF